MSSHIDEHSSLFNDERSPAYALIGSPSSRCLFSVARGSGDAVGRPIDPRIETVPRDYMLCIRDKSDKPVTARWFEDYRHMCTRTAMVMWRKASGLVFVPEDYANAVRSYAGDCSEQRHARDLTDGALSSV